jgi:hypothetical protein
LGLVGGITTATEPAQPSRARRRGLRLPQASSDDWCTLRTRVSPLGRAALSFASINVYP